MSGQTDNKTYAEAAILAGVLGFFIGGLINVNDADIIKIVLSAVITGVIVFIAVFYSLKLVFAGKNGPETAVKEFTADKKNMPAEKPAGLKKSDPIKGKKLDIVTKVDDDLFDDIYGK